MKMHSKSDYDCDRRLRCLMAVETDLWMAEMIRRLDGYPYPLVLGWETWQGPRLAG